MQGLSISVVFAGILMLISGHPAAPQSDAPHLRAADAICAAPPFDDRSRSLVRRARGYDHILETIVDRCPDVAMIFAEFAVGEISQSGRRPVLEYLWTLDFPSNRVEAQNH